MVAASVVKMLTGRAKDLNVVAVDDKDDPRVTAFVS